VKAAADHGLPAFEAILRLVNAMVAGKLPHLDPFLDSNLIAVEKAGGKGVRPIAVGEVRVRIAALCAMAACPGASASLPPLQLGVGVRGGTKAAGHALRAAMASDPSLQLVRIQCTLDNPVLDNPVLAITPSRVQGTNQPHLNCAG
jgi:hypothetical protein